MEPRITVITLGVRDLERAVAFYRDGLGWPTEGIIGTEFEGGAVAFFRPAAGSMLALWPQQSLAQNAHLPAGEPGPPTFSLGHNVRSREEVDAVLAQAERAGATLAGPAHDQVWGGYSGYFQDPDGHLWEVAYNPQLLPA